MEYRCVLCNEAISENEISRAIDFAEWEAFGPFGNESRDEGGQLIPPEGVNWHVTYDDHWGRWVHWVCQFTYGTGLTPNEWAAQMAQEMRDLEEQRG